MKIGIMTWWHNMNYGGFLQGVALQHFLVREGFDAELVSFSSPRADTSVWHLLVSSRCDKLWMLPVWVAQMFRALFVRSGYFHRVERLKKTARLFQRFAIASPMLYKSVGELDRDNRYDVLLVGSDQVWSPTLHDAEFSYLLGGVRDEIPKLSYASSVSAPTIHPYEQLYGNSLRRFKALSVREKSIIPELEAITGRKIEWVVDPTLLLTKDEWVSYMDINPRTSEQHITLYWLSGVEAHLDEILRFARRCKCRVHLFTELGHFDVKMDVREWPRYLIKRMKIFRASNLVWRLNADAKEFLSDIATSDCVVSDSFHAMMFAAIFNKSAQIVITKSRQAMRSRIVDFVEVTGSARLIDGLDAAVGEGLLNVPSCLDLAEWISNSKEFLISNLRKCISSGQGV